MSLFETVAELPPLFVRFLSAFVRVVGNFMPARAFYIAKRMGGTRHELLGDGRGIAAAFCPLHLCVRPHCRNFYAGARALYCETHGGDAA
ncbi:MAG: hypothetical protein DBX55_02675 [Verrucomicrobia bacterium]|nr:MAG: hypothetical protein DBX55_02675 [Verrucomicrobiota bacterium]